MSDTILIAIITASSTTIPAIIVVILNNRYNLKLKEYEATTLQKQQVASDFLENIGSIISYDGGITGYDLASFHKSCNKLLLYFPNLNLDLIKQIKSSVHSSNSDDRIKLINELTKQLSKSMFEKW